MPDSLRYCRTCGGIILQTDERCPACSRKIFQSISVPTNVSIPNTRLPFSWMVIIAFSFIVLISFIVFMITNRNQEMEAAQDSSRITASVNLSGMPVMADTPTPTRQSITLTVTRPMPTPTKIRRTPLQHQPSNVILSFNNHPSQQQWQFQSSKWENKGITLDYAGNGTASAMTNQKFENFILSFQTEWVNGGQIGEWGVDVGYTDANNYLGFFVRKDGRYEVGKRTNGGFVSLFQGKLEKPTEFLKFQIESEDGRYRFFIDDNLAVEYEEPTHPSGSIVLIATNGEVPFTVIFSDLVVSKRS